MAGFEAEITEKCSETDCACYRRMVAQLAVQWLVQADDIDALVQLRNQIADALVERAKIN